MQVQPAMSINNYKSFDKSDRSVIYPVSPSFKAHTQTERLFKIGFDTLVHQTAFDRESQTKAFVCDYIRKTFPYKKKIRIVSAGCSTGEEPLTYSMRLHDIKDRVDILGIDLGKNAIKQAKSGRFVLEIPNDKYNKSGTQISPYTDSYLVEDAGKNLSSSQAEFKKLFEMFFEPTGEKIKTSFGEWFQNMVLRLYGVDHVELTRKSYKLKNGMADNCRFVRGDVRDIDKILNGEKVDVISFCNALYHLTTTDCELYARMPKRKSETIVEKLMSKFKNCLDDDGIVVFGEREGKCQLFDDKVVPRVMNRLDFIPLNYSKYGEVSVWQKGKPSL